MLETLNGLVTLEFPERLAWLRKEKSLTQKALAEAVGIHVTQLRRYEAGTSQPTLDILKKLAVALSVSADLLLFDKDERGPDEDLRLQFEAVSRMSAAEKRVVKELIEGMILKHEARRWASGERT
jgi:transcriptional regulator with XRE-family HTH domain